MDGLLDLESVGVYLVIGLAGVFLLWYFVGAYLTRRRLAVAARWAYRGLENFRDEEPSRTRASTSRSLTWSSGPPAG